MTAISWPKGRSQCFPFFRLRGQEGKGTFRAVLANFLLRDFFEKRNLKRKSRNENFEKDTL